MSDYDEKLEEINNRLMLYSKRLENVEATKPYSYTVELALYPLRWLGWILILAALIDFANMLIPFKLFASDSAVWGFSFSYIFIQHLLIFILGFLGVFLGGVLGRKAIEFILLKAVAILCVMVAIFSFLLIPFAIMKAMNINSHQYQTQLKAIYDGLTKIETSRTKINASNKEDLATVLTELKINLTLTDDITEEQIQQIKSKLQEALDQKENQLLATITKLKEQITELKSKLAVIILEGALLAILLLMIFRYNTWVFKPQK